MPAVWAVQGLRNDAFIEVYDVGNRARTTPEVHGRAPARQRDDIVGALCHRNAKAQFAVSVDGREEVLSITIVASGQQQLPVGIVTAAMPPDCSYGSGTACEQQFAPYFINRHLSY
jgi:hypothetical protein